VTAPRPRFKERLRREILRKRGLQREGTGHLGQVPKPKLSKSGKTLAMRLLQELHGKPIEELLMEGNINEVGAALYLDPSTVSKWRLRLGLR